MIFTSGMQEVWGKKRQLNRGKNDSEDENLVKSGVVTEMNQVTSCQKSRKSKGYKLHILVNTNDAVILSVAALVSFLFYLSSSQQLLLFWDQGRCFCCLPYCSLKGFQAIRMRL